MQRLQHRSEAAEDLPCADFVTGEYAHRGYDNGHYIGHDEPSIGFYSTLHHSGNAVQWDITLPVERTLPAVQSFENYVTFWFSIERIHGGQRR